MSSPTPTASTLSICPSWTANAFVPPRLRARPDPISRPLQHRSAPIGSGATSGAASLAPPLCAPSGHSSTPLCTHRGTSTRGWPRARAAGDTTSPHCICFPPTEAHPTAYSRPYGWKANALCAHTMTCDGPAPETQNRSSLYGCRAKEKPACGQRQGVVHIRHVTPCGAHGTAADSGYAQTHQ